MEASDRLLEVQRAVDGPPTTSILSSAMRARPCCTEEDTVGQQESVLTGSAAPGWLRGRGPPRPTCPAGVLLPEDLVAGVSTTSESAAST
jgi:hypothetical protein